MPMMRFAYDVLVCMNDKLMKALDDAEWAKLVRTTEGATQTDLVGEHNDNGRVEAGGKEYDSRCPY